MSAPTLFPPFPGTSGPGIVTTIDANPLLEFTVDELGIVKKWTTLYNDADKNERIHMLRTKILPRLLPLNSHLSSNDWKFRKSVSTTTVNPLLNIH
jgi:hypothetical protein